MTKFLALSQIDLSASRALTVYDDDGVVVENGALSVSSACVNASHIRSFKARSEGGTFVKFNDGTGASYSEAPSFLAGLLPSFVELSQVTKSGEGRFDDDGDFIPAPEDAESFFVNVDSIRSFKERKGGNGTFIKFVGGSQTSVAECVADVHAVVIGNDDINGADSDVPRLEAPYGWQNVDGGVEVTTD